MGTHGRPVMGSHRPGPMGPSIVLAPPPGWPDVARSQHFESTAGCAEKMVPGLAILIFFNNFFYEDI